MKESQRLQVMFDIAGVSTYDARTHDMKQTFEQCDALLESCQQHLQTNGNLWSFGVSFIIF